MVNYKLLEAKVLQYQADKEYNRTPLMWAVRTKEVDDLNFLLSPMSKAQVQEEVDKQDTWGWTPLHLACMHDSKLEVVQILLDSGANPDARDSNQETPLLKAIQSAQPAVVQMLSQHGANLGAGQRQEALDVAESYGLTAIIKLLKQAANSVS
jgi:ankyrin repeat protein